MRCNKLIWVLWFLVIMPVLVACASKSNQNSMTYGDAKFKQTWEYSDKLVSEVPGAGRGYTWGQNSFGILQEEYNEAPAGRRMVQYFNKSRMELAPDGNSVTNGLLTKELVGGLRQVGEAKYIQFEPSKTQIAGDDNSAGGNTIAPAYASFKKVVTFSSGENIAPSRVNQAANLGLGKAGEVATLTNPPTQLLIGYYESTLGHNVPKVFEDYQNLSGQVWNGTNYQKGRVYTENPTTNVFGYPISEAYWVRAVVAGVEKDVLVQLFERRVLTYTPSNAEPFKVEMGNIGQHYYQWRYLSGTAIPAPPAAPAAKWWLPTPDKPIHWHWQLSEDFVYPRDVLPNVEVYDIDGEHATAETVAKLHALGPNVKVICYFDAGVYETYRSDAGRFPKSVIGNADTGWDGSYWLDIRQTNILLPIMRDRIQQWCKDKGFDAIEPDETEVWSNKSGFSITKEQNNFYNQKIAEIGHSMGLSVGLKGNTGETPELWPYFDWTLNEQCWHFKECNLLKTSFIDHNKAVFNIEYETSPDCNQANSWHMNSALRDLNLVGSTNSAYRYTPCVSNSKDKW